MSILAELLVNLLMVLLLSVTIGYCWVLNGRIRQLQDSRSELAELLQHFDESTTRASESVAALQATSRKTGELMQAQIDKANHVADDLAFLIERASRQSAMVETPPGTTRVSERLKPDTSPAMDDDQPIASLQAMLEKLATKVSDPSLRAPRAPAPPMKAQRSRMEQELLDALKSVKA